MRARADAGRARAGDAGHSVHQDVPDLATVVVAIVSYCRAMIVYCSYQYHTVSGSYAINSRFDPSRGPSRNGSYGCGPGGSHGPGTSPHTFPERWAHSGSRTHNI